jgi:hypothetical protein
VIISRALSADTRRLIKTLIAMTPSFRKHLVWTFASIPRVDQPLDPVKRKAVRPGASSSGADICVHPRAILPFPFDPGE